VALKVRADTAYRCEWEPGEQAALEAALLQFPAERFAPLERYVRVAALLPRKCVRDVALRCAWLRERGARKRKADEAPAIESIYMASLDALLQGVPSPSPVPGVPENCIGSTAKPTPVISSSADVGHHNHLACLAQRSRSTQTRQWSSRTQPS